MILKPQDVYVALKVVVVGAPRPTYAHLAAELGMSASEVHASVKRAQAAGFFDREGRPNATALEEFLVHGLKYAFPAEQGQLVRGVPTSYAAEPLRRKISLGADPVPVWPFPVGKVRGVAIMPLHRSAPMAALRDPSFHEYLALADALRMGRARERKYAEIELHGRLQATQ